MIEENSKSTKSVILRAFGFYFLCFWISGILLVTPLLGQSKSTDTGKREVNQTEYPEKRKDRQTWEKIVSFPGMLVNLPFKLVFTGIGGTVGFLADTKIIARVYDFLTSDDGLRAVRPVYTARGGAGIKLKQKNLINEGSKLELSASAGLRYRQNYQLTFKGLSLFNESIFTDFNVGYLLLPDEKFYGIGSHTKMEDKSNFSQEQEFVHVALGARLSPKIDLAALLVLENNNILKGKDPATASTTDRYSPDELPGLETGVKILGGKIGLKYDSRNSIGAPTSGKEILLGGGLFSEVGGDDYGFWKLSLEIKQYIHLFYRRTIVFRIASEMTEPFDKRAVPFYYMAELGRRETIKGFARGRFHDLDMILGSVEYRYPIFKSRETNVDALLFADGGKVSSDITKDFNTDNLQFGFGGGIRLWGSEGESMRLLLSKSKEQYRLYLVLNQ